MSSLKQQGTKALIWDFFGKMTTHGMGFIVSIFLARLLEPSDFGLIAMIMVIIGIATVFTDVGLGGALVQRRRVRPIHYASVFYFNIFIASILSLCTYFSASWIGDFYNNHDLIPLAEVMSLSFIIAAFSSVQNVKLRKELNYALLTKVNLISSLMSGIVGVSMAFYGAGVWSLVAQSLSQGVIYNVLIWSTANWKPTFQFSFKALMQLWGYGFRMFLSGLLNAIFTRLDYLIIGKLFEATALGFFQRAKSLNLFVVKYSSGSLMSVLFPVLSKVQNDLPRFQNIVIMALGIISFVTFMLLGGLYLTSQELIVLLFGTKWLASVHYFKILALSGFAYPVSALLVNVLSSRGNSKAFLRLEIYKKLIVSVNFLVLYFYGIDAFLYGLVVQAGLGVSFNIAFASQEIALPFFQFAKPILTQAGIAVCAVLLTLFVTQNIELMAIIMLILKGSIFIFFYVGLNYLLKTSSFENFLEQVLPIIRKKTNKEDK